MDSTLIEFTDMKWHRGDISFIFSGRTTGEFKNLHFPHVLITFCLVLSKCAANCFYIGYLLLSGLPTNQRLEEKSWNFILNQEKSRKF